MRQWKDMIRGGDKKPDSKESNSAAGKRSGSDAKAGPPEKKLKADKLVKLGNRVESPARQNSTDGSQKKTHDSNSFMNSLMASAAAPIKKKRRNSDKGKPSLPLDELLSKSPSEKKSSKDKLLESEGGPLSPCTDKSPSQEEVALV